MERVGISLHRAAKATNVGDEAGSLQVPEGEEPSSLPPSTDAADAYMVLLAGKTEAEETEEDQGMDSRDVDTDDGRSACRLSEPYVQGGYANVDAGSCDFDGPRSAC